jgi:hypothetical protein
MKAIKSAHGDAPPEGDSLVMALLSMRSLIGRRLLISCRSGGGVRMYV